MRTRHTPGPWKVFRYADGKADSVGDAISKTAVVREVSSDNADLIAAAPELLEALRIVAGLFPEPPPPGSYWDGYQCAQISLSCNDVNAIRAAIAKAGGR